MSPRAAIMEPTSSVEGNKQSKYSRDLSVNRAPPIDHTEEEMQTEEQVQQWSEDSKENEESQHEVRIASSNEEEENGGRKASRRKARCSSCKR
ncbi:hypothetical protein PIB30_080457 [Stylosanthes scabra]|uniref:Uncharacterized protein n=1 Tax=Stylosanthes scabra TaxID=79078 RepID=A0ABU6TST1_9FABA|nr:hypothetical protein [Stylosanthes scabra]